MASQECRMDTETLPSELSRPLDDSTLKSRAKRESRRKRELEQATFSLKLLKVRSNTLPLSDETENKVSSKAPPLCSSLQSSLDSHGSFELLSVDDMELEATDLQRHDPLSKNQSALVEGNKSAVKLVPESEKSQPKKPEPTSLVHAGQSTSKPLFYISDEASSPAHSEPHTPSKLKSVREKKESLVFVISMQKESPVDQSSLDALESLEKEAEWRPGFDQQKIASSSTQPGNTPRDHSTIQPSPASSSGTTRIIAQQMASQPRKEEDAVKMQAQKKTVAHSISISMKGKATSLAFSPKRSRLTFSKWVCRIKYEDPTSVAVFHPSLLKVKYSFYCISFCHIFFLQTYNQISLTHYSVWYFFSFINYRDLFFFFPPLRSDKDLANQERSVTLQRERTSGFKSLRSREVKMISHIYTNCLLIPSEWLWPIPFPKFKCPYLMHVFKCSVFMISWMFKLFHTV